MQSKQLPLANLVSLFYYPLRINEDYPSNSNNTKFIVSAGSNSYNHKTLSHAITKNIISRFASFHTEGDSCGKPSWLSIIHISVWAEIKKSALTAAWHSWIETDEIWPCSDFPEWTQLSLACNSHRKYNKEVSINTNAQSAADEPALCSLPQLVSIPGSTTQRHFPQRSHKE